MINKIPVPKYKKGDRVRETHVLRLKTVKVNYGISKTPKNIKPKEINQIKLVEEDLSIRFNGMAEVNMNRSIKAVYSQRKNHEINLP